LTIDPTCVDVLVWCRTVPIRTAGDHPPYRLQDFQLRIFNSTTIEQASSEVVDEHLAKVVTQASEVAQEEGWSTGRELRIANFENGEDPTPWFTSYQDQFFRMLAFSEHESFDHPVACRFLPPECSLNVH
jgi:hypothetical protein